MTSSRAQFTLGCLHVRLKHSLLHVIKKDVYPDAIAFTHYLSIRCWVFLAQPCNRRWFMHCSSLEHPDIKPHAQLKTFHTAAWLKHSVSPRENKKQTQNLYQPHVEPRECFVNTPLSFITILLLCAVQCSADRNVKHTSRDQRRVGQVPRICNSYNAWQWHGSFTLCLLYPRRQSPGYTLGSRLNDTRCLSGAPVAKGKCLPVRDSTPCSSGWILPLYLLSYFRP